MNNKTIYAIIAKNIRLLIRAKAGAALIVLGPLLLIIVAGIAFDHSEPYQVNVAVYSDSYNALSTGLLDRLKQSNFEVEESLSAEDCIESIRHTRADACIVFPPDMSYQSGRDTVEFTVDYNQVELVHHILNVFQDQIQQESDIVRRELASNLLNAVEITRKEVEQNRPLVVGLATGVEEIKDQTNKAKSTLTTMSIAADKDISNIDLNATITTLLRSLVNDTDAVLAQSIAELGALHDSTSNQTIRDDLTVTRNELTELRSDLSNESTVLYSRLDDATNKTKQLSQRLNDIIAHLSELQSTRDTVRTQLGGVEERIQNNLIIALKLQESINTLSTSLGKVELSKPDDLARPFRTVINPVSPRQTYFAYVFPPLLLIVALFGALIIAPTLVHLERSSPAYVRTRLAHSTSTYFTATYLTVGMIVLAQVLTILAIGFFFLSGISILTLLQTSIIALIAIALFTALGILIGYSFKSESTAITSAITAAALIILTSGLLLPLESVPSMLRSVLALNPLTFSGGILRSMMLYNASIFSQLGKTLLLIAATIILTGIALYIAKKNE